MCEAQRSGCQIGKTLSIHQDDKPTVLGQKVQPPLALLLRPFDGLIASFQVQGGGAPADQGQPAALGVGDHLAQLFADQGGALEIMVLANQSVPAVLLLGRDQLHLEFFQDSLFLSVRHPMRLWPPPIQKHSKTNVPQNRIPPLFYLPPLTSLMQPWCPGVACQSRLLENG